MPLLLLIPVIFLYWPVTHAQFVYDDLWFVVNNPGIRALTPWAFFSRPDLAAHPVSGLATDLYRPLALLSFALDYHMWGLWSPAYHIENLLLHLFNGLLLREVLSKVLKNATAALIGTLVFWVHPVQVQSVAWVAQRSNLLGAFFFLGALLCFMEDPKPPARRFSLGIVLYGLALFTKETTIVLPILLMVLHGRIQKSQFLRRYGALILLSLLYVVVRRVLLHHWSQTTDLSEPLWQQWGLGLMAFPVYLGKLILPLHLRPSYDYPVMTPFKLGGSLMILMFYLWFVWRVSVRSRTLAVALAWIIVALLPVLQIIPIRAFVAERFLYIPMMGFSWAVAWFWQEKKNIRWPLCIGILGLMGFTWKAVPCWGTEQTLWAYAIRQEPTNAFAHACYASSLSYTDLTEAERHYRLALQNNPGESLRQTVVHNLEWIRRQREAGRRN